MKHRMENTFKPKVLSRSNSKTRTVEEIVSDLYQVKKEPERSLIKGKLGPEPLKLQRKINSMVTSPS